MVAFNTPVGEKTPYVFWVHSAVKGRKEVKFGLIKILFVYSTLISFRAVVGFCF